MTQDEIIRMAREAGIRGWHKERGSWFEFDEERLLHFAALVAANEREKQAEQEPVAYTNKEQLGYLKDPRYQAAPMAMWSKPFDKRINIPLYAAPVSIAKQSETDSSSSLMRTTVRTKDLTDDEIVELWRECAGMSVEDYARAVIAADREKNK